MKIQKYFSIPSEFLKDLQEYGGFEEFALWLKLKTLFFRHTIIYNWSYSRLSQLTKISIPTLQKYVPKLIERGWAIEKDRHLLLCSWKSVCGPKTKNSEVINITKSMKYNEVLDRVRSLIIQRDLNSQEFIIRLRTGRLKASAQKQRKWMNKYRGSVESVRKESNLLLTSTRRISKQIGLSQSGAWLLVKRLNKEGILKLKPVLELLSENCSYVPITEVDNGYLYWKNNKLYLNRGTGCSIAW